MRSSNAMRGFGWSSYTSAQRSKPNRTCSTDIDHVVCSPHQRLSRLGLRRAIN